MQPPEVTPKAFLTPAQRRWVFLLLATIVGGLVGRYLPGTPVPPLPAEVVQQIAETHAAAKTATAGVAALNAQVDHLQRVMTTAGGPRPVKVFDTGKD